MDTENINIILFFAHTLLLASKLTLLFVVYKDLLDSKFWEKENIFLLKSIAIILLSETALFVLMQSWFLLNFFITIDLYLYEYVAIMDQSLMSSLVAYYLIKEVSNGKRKK